MQDRTEDLPESYRPPARGGPFRWLTEPRGRLLLPLSGLWILALDWLLFSSNLISLGLATPIVITTGFVLGAAGTYYAQKRFARDVAWKALLKALVAGCVVGVPWPLSGTVVGGWVLLASGITSGKRESPRDINRNEA